MILYVSRHSTLPIRFHIYCPLLQVRRFNQHVNIRVSVATYRFDSFRNYVIQSNHYLGDPKWNCDGVRLKHWYSFYVVEN